MTRRRHRLSDLVETYVSTRTAEGAISRDSTRTVRSVLRRFIEAVGDRPATILKPAMWSGGSGRWVGSLDPPSRCFF